MIGAPLEFIDAGNEPAGFAVVGSQKGWATAQPGRPIELILREHIGNPIIIVDEVDKVGAVNSSKGLDFALTNALLPLLEPLSARTWSCPFFRVRFDMRWISWVLTANNRDNVPAPLLSRCHVIDIPSLSGKHLAHFARREGVARGLPGDLADEIADTLERGGHGMDLRAAIRLIDGLVARENRPVLQ